MYLPPHYINCITEFINPSPERSPERREERREGRKEELLVIECAVA